MSGRGPEWVYAVNMKGDPDWASMKSAGTGIVIPSDYPSPAAADHMVQQARAHGVKIAIAVAAPVGITPESYASRVTSAKSRWDPSMMVLDVEAPGKGYGPRAGAPQGDPGWQFSSRVTQLLGPTLRNTSFAVTMEPNQDDYNYKAYTDLGAEVWPQAYGGDMTPFDPDEVRRRVIANGVDPTKVLVKVGTNASAPGSGRYGYFGIPGGQFDSPAGYAPSANPSSSNAAPSGSAYAPRPVSQMNPGELRRMLAQRVSANIQDRVGGG